jgi:hypothetical protein
VRFLIGIVADLPEIHPGVSVVGTKSAAADERGSRSSAKSVSNADYEVE